MNRRKFLGTMGAVGSSAFIPSSLNLTSLYKSADAAINYTGDTALGGPDVTVASVPSVMPQVINIFLYGGPSELAGNLTNIDDIELNSQNSYDAAFPGGILRPQGDPMGGMITLSEFWGSVDGLGVNGGAGGDDMQFMVDNGYMTVYRTLMKRLNTTRSHRISLLMSQKGSLDVEVGAGMGTRLAAMLYNNRAAYQGVTRLAGSPGTITSITDDLILPYVSFEGDTRLFAPDIDIVGTDEAIPLTHRGITLDSNFDNPFQRNNNGNAQELNDLVDKVKAADANRDRYSKVVDSFELRKFLDTKVAALTPVGNPALTEDGSGSPLPALTDAADIAANGGLAQLSYPANNRFRDRIRAAVTLAIENPSSLFITVGGGLGGWDDHNNATTRYPDRMTDLMAAVRSAMLHIKYSGNQTVGINATPGTVPGNGRAPGGGDLPALNRPTNNIIINIHGDFGRLVNLNGPAGGWDHANNQNLYTLGGAGVMSAGSPLVGGGTAPAPRTLGKVVGTTERQGAPNQNNQFTVPTATSYEAEPMSLASTVYSYFGATNPNALTADDTLNPDGVPAIDETAT